MADDACGASVQLLAGCRQLRRLVGENRAHRLDGGIAAECAFPRQHLVQDRAERKDVGSLVRRPAADLFGRHISNGSKDGARLRSQRRRLAAGQSGMLRLDQLRQTEVEDFDSSILGDEDVLRLQVPVDDPFFMRRSEPACDLRRIVERFAHRQRRRRHPLTKIPTFQQLGDDIRPAFVRAEIVDRQNTGMVQRRCGPCLLLEPPQQVGVAGE